MLQEIFVAVILHLHADHNTMPWLRYLAFRIVFEISKTDPLLP